MAETDGRPIGEDDLHACVDERLAPARLAELRRWLAANPAEAARVADWKAQRDLLRAALAPLAGAPLPPRLRAAEIRAGLRRRRLALLRPAAAAVVLLLLGSGAGWLARGRPPGEPAAAPAATDPPAALAHRTYAADPQRPMELLTNNPERLAAWFSRRLEAPVVVPVLAAEGYGLVGGRVLPAETGGAVLAVYQAPGRHSLTFYAALTGRSESRPMRCNDNPDGSLTYLWNDLLFEYGITATDLPRERLRVLARLAEQEVRQGPRAPEEAPRIAVLHGPARPACLG